MSRRLLILIALLPLVGCPPPPHENGPIVADPAKPQPKIKSRMVSRSSSDLMILDALDWSSKYLKAVGLRLTRINGSLRLSVRNSERTAAALAGACLVLRQRMNLIAGNVSNAETSRLSAPAGSPPQPYRRKTLSVGAKGTLEVIEDKSAFRKSYRPGHPDADKDGNVLLPNVYIAVEMHEWRSTRREYEVLRLALNKLSNKYVVPPALLLPEPKVPPPYEPKKIAPKPTVTPKPEPKPKTVPVERP